MKCFLLGFAGVVGAVSGLGCAPAAAATAPPKPADALKREFAPKRGVRFTTWGGTPKPSLAKRKVSVTVHTGADGLPRRVVTSYEPVKAHTVRTEVRYTSWGTKAGIRAPRGASVADGSRFSPR
jgi:hypothetical protein